MDKAREANLIEGFEIGRERVKLSHLQFVDDTIFFLSKDEEKLENLFEILNIFGLALGLKINMAKSALVGINVGQEEMVSLANVVGCEVGSWPLSYLGMPLGDNPSQIGFWNRLLKRCQKDLKDG